MASRTSTVSRRNSIDETLHHVNCRKNAICVATKQQASALRDIVQRLNLLLFGFWSCLSHRTIIGTSEKILLTVAAASVPDVHELCRRKKQITLREVPNTSLAAAECSPADALDVRSDNVDGMVGM